MLQGSLPRPNIPFSGSYTHTLVHGGRWKVGVIIPSRQTSKFHDGQRKVALRSMTRQTNNPID